MNIMSWIEAPFRKALDCFRQTYAKIPGISDPSKLQQQTPKGTFPFEKLPTEIRLEILRLAIPSIGSCLRAKRFGISKTLRQSQRRLAFEEHTRFRNICLVNHWMLFEARAILHREVYYNGIEFLHRANERNQFPSLGPHFKSMQCYHFNLVCFGSDIAQAGWYTNTGARIFIRALLECLNSVLMARKNIRRLKFTLPCLQTLPQREATISEETQNIEFLSPLRHLRVVEPVVFKFVRNPDLPGKSEATACDCCKCQEMLQRIHARYGRLQGEPMSRRDKEWLSVRKLVSIGRYDDEILDRWKMLDFQLHDDWGRDIDPPSTFYEDVKETKAFILEKRRKWKQQRSTCGGAIIHGIANGLDDLAHWLDHPRFS